MNVCTTTCAGTDCEEDKMCIPPGCIESFSISNTTIFIIGGCALGGLIVITIFCICRHQRDMSKDMKPARWTQGQNTTSFNNTAARPTQTSNGIQLPDTRASREIVLTPLKLV